MTREEKEILLKDLCARLPYGVKVHIMGEGGEEIDADLTTSTIDYFESWTVQPYLRPMSSMTEEEAEEVCRLENYENRIICVIPNHTYHFTVGDSVLDWLNAKHFDYRGLIPMSLALEAPKDMYKTE